MESQSEQARELERSIAAQKSYVGASLAVFLLYLLFYFPGLVFNMMWLREASAVQRSTGKAPPGKGCLTLMLVVGLVPLIMFVLLVVFIFVPLVARPDRAQKTDATRRAKATVTAPVIKEDGAGPATGSAPEQSEKIAAPEPTAGLGEMNELTEKRDAATAACSDGTTFCVRSARLYIRKDIISYLTLDLELFNGTKSVISSARFDSTLYSTGRTLPWSTPAFRYEFSGGIEPGESLRVSLSPNEFMSEWAQAMKAITERDDCIFEVSPTEALDDEGKPIEFLAFSQADARRLRSLELKMDKAPESSTNTTDAPADVRRVEK